jgi:hypothetical protein
MAVDDVTQKRAINAPFALGWTYGRQMRQRGQRPLSRFEVIGIAVKLGIPPSQESDWCDRVLNGQDDGYAHDTTRILHSLDEV